LYQVDFLVYYCYYKDIKIRSTKSQIINKLKITNSKYKTFGILIFENWILFGIWKLEFRIFKIIS